MSDKNAYDDSGMSDLVADMQKLQALVSTAAYVQQKPEFGDLYDDMLKRAQNTMKTPLGTAYLSFMQDNPDTIAKLFER